MDGSVLGKFLWSLIKKKIIIFVVYRDQFVMEENGYGKIVGRLKEMIIRGGENIFPKEIEDYLNTHPEILETQVCYLFI